MIKRDIFFTYAQGFRVNANNYTGGGVCVLFNPIANCLSREIHEASGISHAGQNT